LVYEARPLLGLTLLLFWLPLLNSTAWTKLSRVWQTSPSFQGADITTSSRNALCSLITQCAALSYGMSYTYLADTHDAWSGLRRAASISSAVATCPSDERAA
jgi:hypothetical protein